MYKYKYEYSPAFREIIQTQSPVPVQFIINGEEVPIGFTLHNKTLSIPSKDQDVNCIQLVFGGDHVDISNYYYLTQKENCPEISHELFFLIANVVASLYDTKLVVKADHSYKTINGFTVSSSVLSMTKPKGRNFYGKYGLLSPLTAPAYEEVAAEVGDSAKELLQRILSAHDPQERTRLKEELVAFTRVVNDKISGRLDYSLSHDLHPAQKDPQTFQSIVILQKEGEVYTPLDSSVTYYPNTLPPLQIVANYVSGGMRNRKQILTRNVRKRKTKSKKYRMKNR